MAAASDSTRAPKIHAAAARTRGPVRLATVNGAPVPHRGKIRIPKRPTLYEKQQCIRRHAEFLNQQVAAMKRVVDAIGSAARSEDSVVLHALWRELSCEMAPLPRIGGSIIELLDG